MINVITLKKYQKYLSSITLKHAIVLAESIKSHGVHLFNMMPYQKFTVLKST